MHAKRPALPTGSPYLRITLQLAAWLFLALGFAVTAGATVPMSEPGAMPISSSAGSLSGQGIHSSRVYSQPVLDPNTVALYHFDTPNTLAIDATGRFNGTLAGGATTGSPGLYGGVLNVDGNGSYVRIANLADSALMSEGTIDLYVDFLPQCTKNYQAIFPIVSLGSDYGGGQPVIQLRVDGYLNFMVLTPTGWQIAVSGINPCRYLADATVAAINLAQPSSGGPYPALWPYEAWRFHHVAGTWGPRGVEIWVDGILHGVGRDDYTPDPNTGNYTYFTNYWCNPQDQVRPQNQPFYPKCGTPVAGVVPNHGSGGGIEPYNVVLVGCDSYGSCFDGRIDEFRISNVQRTFDWTVDPTLTPTPTQTPIPLTGAYSVDPYTMDLYHLDTSPGGQIVDETGKHPGTLSGNAGIVTDGRFGNALGLNGQLSWDGYYTYAHLGNLGEYPEGTWEGWFNLKDASSPFTLLHAGDEIGFSASQLFLGMWPSTRTLQFALYSSGTQYFANSGIDPNTLVGCWHHVAGTWGGAGMQIWVDGVLRGTTPYTGPPDNRMYTYNIGCNALGICMSGKADEVRLSNIQRVFSAGHGPFTQPRLAPNTSSSGLWQFLPIISDARRCPFG